MISAIVLSSSSLAAPPLAADLLAVGFDVYAEADCSNFLHTVLTKAPDIVVCFQETPGLDLFAGLKAVAAANPLPVAVFTTDPDAAKMALATASGVHAYVVDGYSRNRLRSVVQLAQARFLHEQLLRQELADVQKRFDERKLVDRAKGILMGARQLREEEAFRALRSAAMASKIRIGQMSQVVIDSTHYAEAVNRAGQLRMLSQRIVKFYALACSGVTVPDCDGMFDDSVAQVDSNLAILGHSLSKPTFGDLVGALADAWRKLKTALQPRAHTARLQDVDMLAEQLLKRAETLTANLEVAAFATALHPINVVGRQRMLTHRLAKEALIATLALPRATTEPSTTRQELVDGLAYLDRLPLQNADIAAELSATHHAWHELQRGLAAIDQPGGRTLVTRASEDLFGHFDRLTELIERGIHALLGV